MEDIIKVSETEIQISTPQPDLVEVKSKDQLIQYKDSLIAMRESEVVNYTNRIAALDAEIAKYDTRIEQANLLDVKTQVELLPTPEVPVVETPVKAV